MDLAARRFSRWLEDFVMRLGCLLVSVSLLASLILEPPKAKAFELTSSAVAALAGAFLNACGLSPVVSGMSGSGEVNESLARLIQEYLDAERPGTDIIKWLGHTAIQAKSGNKLVIPAAAVGSLSAFAQWVGNKYGVKTGTNVVYSEHSVSLTNGRSYNLGWKYSDDSFVFGADLRAFSLPLEFSSGFKLDITSGAPNYGSFILYSPSGAESHRFVGTTYFHCFAIDYTRSGLIAYMDDTGKYLFYLSVDETIAFLSGAALGELALDLTDHWQSELDRIAGLEEQQSIAIDVGATDTMTIEEILQGILDAILAGQLVASAEIVDADEAPVDPEDPDPPIVPVIPEGLDRLGAALTSRFPFSIPWDVYKGVKLLAAPAKAPYFEVDFMAPIAHRVGGWKGSTRIVMDFSEYEIIGQVCRWTSTIGFCLMLAAGTKRLIWTA